MLGRFAEARAILAETRTIWPNEARNSSSR